MNDKTKFDKINIAFDKYQKTKSHTDKVIIINEIVKSIDGTRYYSIFSEVPVEIMEVIHKAIEKYPTLEKKDESQFSKYVWGQMKCIFDHNKNYSADEFFDDYSMKKANEKEIKRVKRLIDDYCKIHGPTSLNNDLLINNLENTSGVNRKTLNSILEHLARKNISSEKDKDGKEFSLEDDVKSNSESPHQELLKQQIEEAINEKAFRAIDIQWSKEDEKEKSFFSALFTWEYLKLCKDFFEKDYPSKEEVLEDLYKRLQKYKIMDLNLFEVLKNNPLEFPTNRGVLAERFGVKGNSCGKILEHFYGRVKKSNPELCSMFLDYNSIQEY